MRQSTSYTRRGLQLPRAAHGAGQHPVGLRAVDEALRCGVPLEIAAQAQADVGNVTGDPQAVGNLGRRDGPGPRADAGQEIAVVAFHVLVAPLGSGELAQNSVAGGGDLAGFIDTDPAVGTDELAAAGPRPGGNEN